MKRLNWLKSLLWALFSAGLAAIILRVFAGLGATTNLSNYVSWGIWNAIKFSIVPLSAGAFVMAAIVYIFGLERFHKLLRLCILTGFLGYSTFATMLFFDIGLPYRIWHPIIYWQHHSVLFGVAICVMSYLTVLALEFTPTALEHRFFSRPLFQGIFRLLKRVTIPLVIAGIVLSTLHQSSLGALFLIVPHRLHPLWYTPLIHFLFLISAIGMGLLVVVVEAFFLEEFLGIETPTDVLPSLARAGAGVMIIFTLVRVVDQIYRGVLTAGGGMFYLYMLEIMLATAIPALLIIPSVSGNRRGLFWCSLAAIAGVVLYRCDVSLFAINWGDFSYVPAWSELFVMFGIISGSLLVFLFLIENLDIYGSGEELETRKSAVSSVATIRPASSAWVGGVWVAAPRRYSLIMVLAASIAVGWFGSDVLWGSESKPAPVLRPRTIKGVSAEHSNDSGHEFRFAELGGSVPETMEPLELLMIDGNRDGRFVLFPHENHKKELGGEQSCVLCHHQSMPFDRNTMCHECHRDMYANTDIFEHTFHIEKLNDDSGCVKCHTDGNAAKNRQTSAACAHCHADMIAAGSRVKMPDQGSTGFAPAYMHVLHELCIKCHEERSAKEPESCGDAFARCDCCHGAMDGTDLLEFGPYARPQLISAKRDNNNALEGYQKVGSYRGL